MDLSLRLQDWLQKWMTGCETVEEVVEKILVEQLLETMPTELKIWVAEKPVTGREAAVLADDYLQACMRASKPLPTWKGKNHTDTRTCHTCQQEGHLARNCPMKSNPIPEHKLMKDGEKEGAGQGVKYYNCGGCGHISTNCPDKVMLCSEESIRLKT